MTARFDFAEFGGWAAVDQAWWYTVTGDEGRSEFFELADRTIVVADAAAFAAFGPVDAYDTLFRSPTITLGGSPATLSFDQAWSPGANMVGVVEVTYDNGANWEPVQTYTSDPSRDDFLAQGVESVSFDLANPDGANSARIRFVVRNGVNGGWWALDNIDVSNAGGSVFSEDFSSFPLRDQFTGLTNPLDGEVWTHTTPDGWTSDNSGVPLFGAAEWENWSFTNLYWWSTVAEDQGRQSFTNGQGIVAVADPDEWADASPQSGTDADGNDLFDAFLTTPDISLEGVIPGTAVLNFDSGWRSEDTQTALITITYIDASGTEVGPTEILRWESDSSSPFFKPDALNETISLPLENPAGAQSMRLDFGMVEAGNDWYWVIDNLEVTGQGGPVPLGANDFENAPLGSPVSEFGVAPRIWTPFGKDGWTVSNEGTPEGGVAEWRQWTIAPAQFWVQVAGDQDRSDFTKAVGNVAIADGDEWDDATRGDGTLNTFMVSEPIDISGIADGNLQLVFDSSFRPFADQTGTVSVSLDGGETFDEILVLDGSTTNDTDFRDSTFTLDIANPGGSNEVILQFAYTEAGNDWWWAIDNIALQDTSGGSPRTFYFEGFSDVEYAFGPVDEVFNGNDGVPGTDDDQSWTQGWAPELPANWTRNGEEIPEGGVTEWRGWHVALEDLWRTTSGNQARNLFTRGQGAIAIADPDEWDDAANQNPGDGYNARMELTVDITDAPANSLVMEVDSSFRPEVNQDGIISVSFDGGASFDQLLFLDSTGSNNSILDFINDHYTFDLANPAGATEAIFKFELVNAGNNWWWAIDNFELNGNDGTFYYFDGFDGVTFEETVDEGNPYDSAYTLPPVWTNQNFEGWTIDNSAMDTSEGRPEWAGWAFAQQDWWTQIEGDQDRSAFTLADNVVAVADSDAWDDYADTPGTTAVFDSTLISPVIDIAGISPNTAFVSFVSHWRNSQSTESSLTAVFTDDSGNEREVEIFNWVSGSGQKDNALNESLNIPLGNLEGEETVQLRFRHAFGTNAWPWAIDNVQVTGIFPLEDIRLDDGNLSIDGTFEDDIFQISDDGVDQVTVIRNGVDLGTFTVTGRVTIDSSFGNDLVDAELIAPIPVVVNAGGGSDTVTTGEGDDSVRAGDDDDIVFTGEGADTVVGGGGDDSIVTARGFDVITDLSGNNFVRAGDGEDVITTGAGDDTLEGNRFADFIDAGDGNNVVDGGGDDDTIIAGSGDDILRGQFGDDLFMGNGGDDTILGGNSRDTMFGGEGADFLDGGNGFDSLLGESGDDVLIDGRGRDTLDGGEGADEYQVNHFGQSSITEMARTNRGDYILRRRDLVDRAVLDADILAVDEMDVLMMFLSAGDDILEVSSDFTGLRVEADGGTGVDLSDIPDEVAENFTLINFED